MSYNQPRRPKFYSVDVSIGETYSLTMDSPLWFLQMSNVTSGNYSVAVTFNDDPDCVFVLDHNESRTFSERVCDITKVAFTNLTSGNGTVSLEIMVAVTGTDPVTGDE